MTQYKNFDQILAEVASASQQQQATEREDSLFEADHSPLVEAEAIEILKHRDAHFGGRFDIMLDAYREEKAGAVLDVTPEEIERLAEVEKAENTNLAAMFLSGADADAIAAARKAYQSLRDIYDVELPESSHPRLLADLVLSQEEDPEQAMEAVVREGEAIVPALLHLLDSDPFWDPLYPGFGRGPMLAAECLGIIGDERAIAPLFVAMERQDFFDDEVLIRALKNIGDKALDFVIERLKSRPLSEDNIRAAIILTTYEATPAIGAVAAEQLHEPTVRANSRLGVYLALACAGVDAPEERDALLKLADDPTTAPEVALELKESLKN